MNPNIPNTINPNVPNTVNPHTPNTIPTEDSPVVVPTVPDGAEPPKPSEPKQP